jgi:hypothetical protein
MCFWVLFSRSVIWLSVRVRVCLSVLLAVQVLVLVLPIFFFCVVAMQMFISDFNGGFYI